MDPTRKERYQGTARFRNEVDRMLLELTGADRMFGCPPQAFRPNADVYYDKVDNSIFVKLELPGVDPQAVHLEVQDRLLKVSGQRIDRRQREKVYQQMEVFYGAFERRIMLPVEVDPSAAEAHYEDGFLEIKLPLVPTTESRRIPIVVKDEEAKNAEHSSLGTAESADEDGTT
jgi:HSP20 family protein